MVIRSKKTASTMALSTSQAKTWVKTHYERHEDGVVAKSVMYKHYEDFCRQEGRSNMETSIFGRVVKNVFADVTIRRLGGRDNLKYYYCGIRAKESSPHAIDNKTTTRPKRRLRKRELVTNKSQVDTCLRWLRANFVDSPESSVVKTDVYERYLTDCHQRSAEALSIQYFGMVITHAFPHVTKRKLGPRTNQQKYYFGIQERSSPMPLDNVHDDFMSVDSVLSSNRNSYREASNIPEEEEEDFDCRSPSSDISDQHLSHYDQEDYSQQYAYANYVKEDVEPVDYSLSSLRLKTEPPEEELTIKCDPSDIQMEREYADRQTPERPSSVATSFGGMSPVGSERKSTPRKIYKPRFHFDYSEPSSWNGDSRDGSLNSSYYSTECDPITTKWISNNFVLCPDSNLDRMHVFSLYEKYCDMMGVETFPLTRFDEIMLKELDGVVTMIRSDRKTFYAGIRVRDGSRLSRFLEEVRHGQDQASWSQEEEPQVIDMSNGSSPSHSVPLSLEDEDEFQDNNYACGPDDDSSSPQVLKDGKFFLRNWLQDNFEPVNDSCVLKAEAYKHYEAYARSINQTPFEMNVFGKIVWQVFPDVTVRRLGGRSKPQYHYCGITVKSTSPLYHMMSGRDPVQRSRKKEIATDNRSAEIVIDWLKQNYEAGKNKIITKSEVFDNYSKYCLSINENPVNLNYFGKLVKYCFSNVEVRKFGGRSDPTWCYYGLAPREGSALYHLQSDIASRDSLPYLLDIRNDPRTSHSFSPIPTSVGGNIPLHVQGHSSNPIPISSAARNSPLLTGTPIQHSFGSPTLFQDNQMLPIHMKMAHASPRDQYDPRIHNRLEVHDSVDQRSHYSRRSPFEASETSSEILLSRSPLESECQGPLLYGSTSIPREHLMMPSKFSPHFGAQVVPSHTPPSLLSSHNNETSMAALLQAQCKHKKSLNPEIFGDFADTIENRQ